mmetsp:Transcript_22632/g.34511  ORF Transcript_22632/g.34511 Transcript_22632/m.34511 type:complete len:224 (-) Transcript_22632:882-1553(-)
MVELVRAEDATGDITSHLKESTTNTNTNGQTINMTREEWIREVSRLKNRSLDMDNTYSSVNNFLTLHLLIYATHHPCIAAAILNNHTPHLLCRMITRQSPLKQCIPLTSIRDTTTSLNLIIRHMVHSLMQNSTLNRIYHNHICILKCIINHQYLRNRCVLGRVTTCLDQKMLLMMEPNPFYHRQAVVWILISAMIKFSDPLELASPARVLFTVSSPLRQVELY